MGGARSFALDSNRHRALLIFFKYKFRGFFFLKKIQQGIACIGAGMIVSFQAIQTYVIDAFTLHAASGTNIIFS